MEATDGRADEFDAGVEPETEAAPTISAYSTNETRVVFTESDNGDGWIATDLTVEPRQ
jgi:hypothetical protein